MRILSIETSCDETSAAVVDYARGSFTVLSNVVASQINIHKKFGGVVPEVAARKQVELIIPVIEQTLQSAAQKLSTKHQQLITKLDALAVTVGPGLQIALSVGVETARVLAAVWRKPIVAVNHLEGHLYSALLPAPSKSKMTHRVTLSGAPAKSKGLSRMRAHIHEGSLDSARDDRRVTFPAIGLIVSGGHTELLLIKSHLAYQLLGRTRDDAAGEAYDKVAKLLGLSYPGGPEIDRLARQGNPAAFDFPRSMMNSGDYDFSFSGLKTAVLYKLHEIQTHRHNRHSAFNAESRHTKRKKHDHPFLTSNFQLPASTLNNLCASFQVAVVDVLIAKTIRAAKQYHAKTILLGGGVAANSQLRRQLAQKTDKLTNCKLLTPSLSYTTDNAAMIAAAAAFHALQKDFTPWQKLRADPSLNIWA